MTRAEAEIGVIGGSGFYEFLDQAVEVVQHTPYGAPSAPLTVGMVRGRRVAFLPRHGVRHEFPPHRVNYRANLWALRDLGVSRVFGPCAAGSLQPGVQPGDFVVLDQLVDRTWGRPDTYIEGPVVSHVTFADPYCPELAAVVRSQGEALEDLRVHARGTAVVIQGPRFSTRAESTWYRSAGWEVINMTQYPEAYLSRELGMCYSGIALVTDYDSGLEGVEGVEPVTMEAVFRMLARNVARTRQLLFAAIPGVPATASCRCHDALASGPFGSS
ncbi:MAG: methylthioadenosine phosphorylase [Armatimonadetes bacterium 13_1_40CM_3_65_7]|nr:MAG: methylthioadenosine phosphorylase [Armatimonadetes bacterium 13_1_40CM_3_65_7]